jgi:hypothetical protein
MNGTNELCWRDAFWTPATANAKCDGALVAQAPTPPAPVTPVAPAITSQKITYQADALFDFDKAILKPAGKEKLERSGIEDRRAEPRSRRRNGLHGPYRFGQVQRPSVAASCSSCQGIPGQQGHRSQPYLYGRQGQAQPGHDWLQPEEPQATYRLPRTGSSRGSRSCRYFEAVSSRLPQQFKAPLRRGFFYVRRPNDVRLEHKRLAKHAEAGGTAGVAFCRPRAIGPIYSGFILERPAHALLTLSYQGRSPP